MSTYIKEPTKEELTNKGFTNRIKISANQNKKSLLAYGFTNHDKSSLCFVKMIERNISFNLNVSIDTFEITSIDVLNEEGLQPYDYQSQILNGNHSGTALNTYNKVNDILEKLQKEHIITGFKKGMYI